MFSLQPDFKCSGFNCIESSQSLKPESAHIEKTFVRSDETWITWLLQPCTVCPNAGHYLGMSECQLSLALMNYWHEACFHGPFFMLMITWWQDLTCSGTWGLFARRTSRAVLLFAFPHETVPPKKHSASFNNISRKRRLSSSAKWHHHNVMIWCHDNVTCQTRAQSSSTGKRADVMFTWTLIGSKTNLHRLQWEFQLDWRNLIGMSVHTMQF